MKIGFGFGYGRRATAATLAWVGLVVLTCMHIRIPVISTAALATSARAQVVSDGRDQGAPPRAPASQLHWARASRRRQSLTEFAP